MSLNLNGLLAGLLHFNHFQDGSTNVDILTVLNEVLRLKLAIGKHILNAELQLVCHVGEIFVDLANAIFEIVNVLIHALIDDSLVKLLDEVVADSIDDARLVHD